tara:strand:- start:5023 stop:5448 length:426 start_codon:yes stop_codon:yes gene_type:complete
MAIIGYVEQTDFTTYATARGITLTLDTAVTLTLALDYIEGQSYKGDKTDPDQVLEFPRDDETVIPQGIKNAQMEAALVYDKGSDPLSEVGPRVTEKTVHGAVTVRYSDTGSKTISYRKLNLALRPFLTNGGSGLQMVATRG